VELNVPAMPEFLSAARLHMGDVATRMDVTIDELETLQLAVEELCLGLLRPCATTESRLVVTFEWTDDQLDVACKLLVARPPKDRGAPGLPETLSGRILDALVDEHGSTLDDDVPGAWLRTRWGRGLHAP
jgi:hypothetical protein